MAKLILKIEKEDIKITNKNDNIEISCQNDIELIFSKNAIDQLILNVESYSKKDVINIIKKLIKDADFISFTEEYGPKGWSELEKWINNNIK